MPIYPQETNEWLRSQVPNTALESGKEIKFDGQQINIGGEQVNIPVVYGLKRVTGPRVYTAVKSNNSKICYTAIAVSEGPITKYHKLFLNDEQVSIVATADQGPTAVTQGTYGGILSYELFSGTRTSNSLTGTNSGRESTLLTEVTGNFQDVRTFTTSMAGIAYIVLKMTYVDNNSPYKAFPKITVEISGRKLRNASTVGYGTEQNVFQDANPADVLLDYLTNTVYGRGMADARIDYTSILALRNSLAITVIPHVNGVATARAKLNMTLDTGKTVLENVKNICRQFNIVMTLANGSYRFIAEYATSTVSMVVNGTHIIDGYTVTIPDLSVKYNSVSVTFNNSFDNFNQSIEIIEDSDAVSTDGKFLDINLNYDAITDPFSARFVAETILRKSRGQITYKFKMVKEALKLTVGDVITFDPNTTGSSTNYLRIISLSMMPDFTFDVQAVTHSDNFYPPFTARSKGPKRVEVFPTPSGVVIASVTAPATVTAVAAPTPIIGPPPGRPVTATKRKITIATMPTTSPSIVVDVLPNGSNFYPAPIEKFQNQNTSVEDADYRLSTADSFSTVTNNGNFGNDVRVSIEDANTKIFYEYKPCLTYRERDLDNLTIGGEGLVVGNGAVAYTKIHYVYEIEPGKFGWSSQAAGNLYNLEKFFFDPQTEVDPIKRTNLNATAETIKLLNCYRGVGGPDIDPNSRSLFGCPYLEYNNARGSYIAPNGLGLRHYVKGSKSTYGAPWQIPGILGGTVPNSNNIWANKNNTTFSITDARQRMTIKYFLINPNTGQHQFIATYTLNLDDARPGDTGIKSHIRSQSYTNYRYYNQTVPFTQS
jgi:hypothetical protein